MKQNAFITEITGRDDAYLADLLIGKGYVVHDSLCSEMRNSLEIMGMRS